MKCLTTWKVNLKVIFSAITCHLLNFESLNNLIFVICLCELCSKSKWEIFGKNASRFQFRWCENNIQTSTLFQNYPPSFSISLKMLPHFSVTFVAHKREYYEWFWGLRHHIQVGRLPFQVTWLGLVVQSVILRSMWPTGQTSNNSVISIRWWRWSLLRGPSLALLHPNSWLETHFVLILAKIIE